MEASAVDIKKIADEAIPAVKEVVEKLKTLRGWNMGSLKAAYDMLPEVAKKVEVIGRLRGLKGSEKKELAIELVTRLRPAPFWLPTPLYRMILGWAVDSIVAALKDRFE